MYSSILVGTDGSKTATEAVRQAMQLAGLCQAKLFVVSSYKPKSVSQLQAERAALPEEFSWAIHDQAEIDAILSAAAAAGREHGVSVETVARSGDPADVIIDEARERGADVIVVGNKGMTGMRKILGSVPNKVAHNAPCHVLIVHTT